MKVLVVDDEMPARERLQRLLRDMDEWDVVGEAANGREALAMCMELEPDLVLLDIRMPGIDGMETARHLAGFEEPPAVIFTTAYDEHALEAFGANAVGYLLKPIQKDKLHESLQRAKKVTRVQVQSLQNSMQSPTARSHICAHVRGSLDLIAVDTIIYFQADQKYVTLCHEGGEVLIEDSLKALEEEFSQLFLRIHRNALIARKALAGMEKTIDGEYCVKLTGTEELLKISRRHVPEVRRILTGR